MWVSGEFSKRGKEIKSEADSYAALEGAVGHVGKRACDREEQVASSN